MTTPAAAWATIAEVSEITGITVDDGQLARAQGVIELAVGRTADATHIGARDLRWLKRAVAYQAAWMKDQADYFTRLDVDRSSQDGASQDYRGRQDLAPLAKTALRKVTWRRSRSVSTESTVGGPYRGHYYLGVEGVFAVHDYPADAWRRL